MVNTSVDFKWISYWHWALFVLSLMSKQIVALKEINVGDCFDTLGKNGTPSCSFQMSEEAHDIRVNCVRPGVVQIAGDYKVAYINCSASYPLDFKFDGHKPTEAIETISWVMVEKNSERKIQSFHLDAKIFSIPSLHDHYATLYPHKKFNPNDSYNYSRSGSYIFSGYNEQENIQSKFHIFFEEMTAIRSFLRNEDVVVRLPNLRSKTEEHLQLVIPCRTSHLNTNVTIQQDGNNSIQFNYDPAIGFTSKESWKSITENNPNLNYNDTLFTCILNFNQNKNDDLMTFSLSPKKSSGMKYGYDGLPLTTSWSIATDVQTLNNGSFIVQHECTFDRKSVGQGILAVQDILSPMMYRLNLHFIFPIFHSRSYSTTVVNSTLRYGKTTEHITSKSVVSNVMCLDANSFHASTIGVGVTGRHIHFPFGFEASQAKEIGNRPTFNYFKILLNQPNQVLYENQVVKFRCYILTFTFIRPAIWYTERANGSVVEEVIDYDWKDNYFSHAQIRLAPDVRKLIVASMIFSKPEWRNYSMDIHFEKAVKPTFNDSQIPIQKFPLSSNKILKCTATGKPQPEIYRQRNGKNITSAVSFLNHTSILEFSDVKEEDAGDYVCVASNGASIEEKMFTVQVFVETDLGSIIGVSITVFICGALAVAIWVYFRLRRMSKAALTKSEIEDFLNGEKSESNSIEKKSDGKEYAHDVTHLRPYNTEFEIDKNRFNIDLSQVLGSGAFGMVVMGTLDGVSVAVKTVKRNADKSYLKALLSELKVMTFLGDHENIVGLLGADTSNLKKGQAFIFVPFCALGSLQEYLRKNRDCFDHRLSQYVNAVNSPGVSPKAFTTTPNVYENTCTNLSKGSLADSKSTDLMTVKDLYQWATQIAQGMEYLSSKKVLHGDLASRNVVLTENRLAKITDFGLSRRLYDYSEYAKTQQEPLPWRWMSLESLRDLTFSTKSDVWSYGITLWEIFSLGQVPYPGYSWTVDFVKELEDGMRMSSPQLASQELYTAVMTECWRSDPQLRPSFAKILENLNFHGDFKS